MADIYFQPPPLGGDESSSTEIILAIAITGSVVTLLVPLRMYVRVCITRSFAWDDVFILMALVSHCLTEV